VLIELSETMVDVEEDGFDGEIRRKVTRKTFKIEEVSVSFERATNNLFVS